MGFMNPKQHADSYKNQEKERFKSIVPVDGVFDVVNVKLQFQTIGKNKTTKLRIIPHVLRVVESEEEDKATAMVGQTMGVDIWWHNPTRDDPAGIDDCDFNLIVSEEGDRLAFNGHKLMNMAIANGCSEDIEENIRDRNLVGLLTGVPYRMKIEVEESEGAKGRTYYNVNVLETKHLPSKARERYTKAPDFQRVVGDPDSRMLDAADFSSGKKPEKKTKSEDDGFFDDSEDLPF